MNKEEIRTLLEVWETALIELETAITGKRYDISRNCYLVFGTEDMTVFKKKGKEWKCKTITGWRNKFSEDALSEMEEMKWLAA